MGAGSVAVQNNGTGAGLLTFANLHVEAGGSVTFTGNVSFPGGLLTVTANPNLPRGVFTIADFTSVPGMFSLSNFTLDPNNSPTRAKLTFKNGLLRLSLLQGTVLILR